MFSKTESRRRRSVKEIMMIMATGINNSAATPEIAKGGENATGTDSHRKLLKG